MQHLNFYIWELIPIGLAGWNMMEWGGRFVDDVFVVCHQGSFLDVASF